MIGKTEARIVKICIQFLTYLVLLAITVNLVWIPFVNFDGLILIICYKNAILYCSLQSKMKF
jgi:hypothetical protein